MAWHSGCCLVVIKHKSQAGWRSSVVKLSRMCANMRTYLLSVVIVRVLLTDDFISEFGSWVAPKPDIGVGVANPSICMHSSLQDLKDLKVSLWL